MTKIGFLFDLDGVLIDSETEYTKIWNTINKAFPSGYDDLAIRIKGMTLYNILNTYYPEPGLHAELTALLNKLEQQMDYRWLPGARELLEELRSRHLPTVLVTSSNELKMKHLREVMPDAESFFTDIVTGDRVSRSKPDPEGYLLGASLIGVEPRHTAVFEDSLQGVKAGHAAGAYVVGVAGTLPADTLKPFSDTVVSSLAEVDPELLCDTLRLHY